MPYLRVKHKTLGTEFSTTEHNPEFETLLAKPAVDSYGAPLPAKHPTDFPSSNTKAGKAEKPEEAQK